MIHFDEVFDVIVIGSGLAGLAAAKEARDAGCSALILEKLDRYGGNSVLAGDRPRLQRRRLPRLPLPA